MMKRIHILLIGVLFSLAASAQGPKREFRGAWIQTVNRQFEGMTTDYMQKTLTAQLDSLQKGGINAVMFQVRPEADALYYSEIEPWSRFLTGTQGQAPSPYWDPLQFMIVQCHRRGMELHAWLNPYRVKTKTSTNLVSNHLYFREPERFFVYDNMIFFNPGIEKNRQFICKIAADITRRYDVDGIHIDDYFYPYPVKGEAIPDEETFRANDMGLKNIEDWRRYNVDLLVKELHDSIVAVKPWVKFGVSPFGIYRNKKSDPMNGSDTNGLQNYDELYADILLWINKGWVDYSVPQLYWESGHKAADYNVLVDWWAKHASARPLFVGMDIERTVKNPDPSNPNRNQQIAKYRLMRSYPQIQGSCQWYAKLFVDNIANYRSLMQEVYHRNIALQPLFLFKDATPPAEVTKLMPVKMKEDGMVLCWTPPAYEGEMDKPVKYVVYRFNEGEEINLNNSENIYTVTKIPFAPLEVYNGKKKFVFVVTALDRLNNESLPAKVAVKL